MANPVAVYDFRVNADGLTEDVIKSSLKRIAKHWVFQEERGDTGYMHYQGRFSLIKKRRKSELLRLWTELNLFKPCPHYLEPTTCGEAKNNSFSYAMKEDTRSQGPWSDKDQEVYIPRQYRGLMERLYPFQKVIFDSAHEFDPRIINLIYCPEGNQGKSTIAALCELHGRGIDLPPVNDAEKLLQSVCDICMSKQIRDPSPIFVDLPRAMDKTRLNGIYTAIEQIKKGKLYDLRYSYKEWWIDSPAIWVFSNIAPDFLLLLKDRWKVWRINEQKELVRMTESDLSSFHGDDDGLD